MTVSSISPPSPAPSQGYRSRRRARQAALQWLFQWEFQHVQGPWVEEFWSKQTLSPAAREFADRLIQGVLSQQQVFDELISKYAVHWKLHRMPIVDRNILRCALMELFCLEEIPAVVTVNEAIELAKRFADDETKRFINGILDQILQKDPRLQKKRAEKPMPQPEPEVETAPSKDLESMNHD